MLTSELENKILAWHENEIQYGCLKMAIKFYHEDGEASASNLLWSEQDKLRQHPDLMELLKKAFPSYRNKLDSSSF